MTELEISYNPNNKKFSLVGPDALDHTSSKKIALNMAEIMQIISLYKKGVFFTMLTNNIVKKNINAIHKSRAELFLLEDPITETSQNQTEDDLDKSTSSSGSATVKRINLWNVYLKHIKATHPDLTHKQAMQYGKSGCPEKNIQPYAEWKLANAD